MTTLTYEEVKAKTLYAYVGNGRYLGQGVFCVTQEVKVYDRPFKLYGVELARTYHNLDLTISSEYSLDPDHLHEWVSEGKAHLTKDVDGAVNDYLQYMRQLEQESGD